MIIESGRHANEILAALRRHTGLTQIEFAQRLFIGVAALRDREHNRRGLSVDALIHTADQLGYDVILVRRDTGEPA